MSRVERSIRATQIVRLKPLMLTAVNMIGVVLSHLIDRVPVIVQLPRPMVGDAVWDAAESMDRWAARCGRSDG